MNHSFQFVVEAEAWTLRNIFFFVITADRFAAGIEKTFSEPQQKVETRNLKTVGYYVRSEENCNIVVTQ